MNVRFDLLVDGPITGGLKLAVWGINLKCITAKVADLSSWYLRVKYCVVLRLD